MHGFWSSDLHWSDRYIRGCDYFFCASTVLVGPNNRAVDLGILVVCLGSQHFKDPLPNTTLAPAHVASMNHPKVAKAFGQIAPGNASAITIEHCLDKEAIILGSHSDSSHSAGEQMLNTLPLIITESISSGGNSTSLQLGKEKWFFPPKRMMCLKRSSVYLMTGPRNLKI